MAFVDLQYADPSMLVAHFCIAVIVGMVLGRLIYRLVSYLYPQPTLDELLQQTHSEHMLLKCCPRCTRRMRVRRNIAGYTRMHTCALAALCVRLESITAVATLIIVAFTFWSSRMQPPELTPFEQMLRHIIARWKAFTQLFVHATP